jgi:hypothetical protein
MSEPSSLYVRVTLSEAAMSSFRQSPVSLPGEYQDWLPWLETQKFYGEITNADIEELGQNPGIRPKDIATAGEFLDFFAEDTAGTRIVHDTSTGLWTLRMLEFSENYYDYIETLAILRALAKFKDLPGEDFVLIFPYLWGDEPTVYLSIRQGSGELIAPTPEKSIAEAKAAMKALVDEVTAGMDLDP